MTVSGEMTLFMTVEKWTLTQPKYSLNSEFGQVLARLRDAEKSSLRLEYLQYDHKFESVLILVIFLVHAIGLD